MKVILRYRIELLISLLACGVLAAHAALFPALDATEATDYLMTRSGNLTAAKQFFIGTTHRLGYWVFSKVFGPSLLALKAYCIAVSAAAVFVVGLIFARHVSGEPRRRVQFGLLLITTPAVVIFGRSFYEIINIGSLLVALGVLFGLEMERCAREESHQKRAIGFAIASGVALGHAAYVHPHLIVLSIIIALGFLFQQRRFVWKFATGKFAIAGTLGFLLGIFPRIVALLFLEKRSWGELYSERPLRAMSWDDIRYIFHEVLGMLDGSAAAASSVGFSAAGVSYVAIVLTAMIGLALLLGADRRRSLKLVLASAALAVAYVLVSRGISPKMATRYFLPLVVAVQFFIVKLAILAESPSYIRLSRAANVIVGGLIILNVTLGQHYVWRYLKTGECASGDFAEGESESAGRAYDRFNQSCYRRAAYDLYEKLKAKGLVVGQGSRTNRIFMAMQLDDGMDPDVLKVDRVIIQHAGKKLGVEEIEKRGHVYRRALDFDGVFEVFVR